MKLLFTPAPHSFVLALLIFSFTLNTFASDSVEQAPKAISTTEYQFNTHYVPIAVNAATDTNGAETNKYTKREVLHQHKRIERIERNQHHYVVQHEHWIYDSWVSLDTDLDYDGYYSQFTIEFDADTIFNVSPVYAVIYIGNNEYYESIHVTSEFYIHGEDAADSFAIESRLISGFPPGEYDVLIELYDGYSDVLVAYSDSYSDADLAYLTLESESYEDVFEDTVVIVHEHGGSTSLYTLTLLTMMLLVRRIKGKV